MASILNLQNVGNEQSDAEVMAPNDACTEHEDEKVLLCLLLNSNEGKFFSTKTWKTKHNYK